jgi:hypothetical protein
MQKGDMHMMWLVLIGAVVGCGLTLLTIFSDFKVMTKQRWKSRCQEKAALDFCLHEAVAVNARLWVARAASKAAASVEKLAQSERQLLNPTSAAATECASPSEFCPSPITSATRI